MPQKIKPLYWLKKKIFTFLGDIKVFGWQHPMWFQINAHGYKLKGLHYYTLQKLIQPGDILIRRYDGYFSSYALPGFWTHCGLYVGNNQNMPEQIIHAISDGIVRETLIEFMRTDYMIVLRLQGKEKKELIKKSIESAKSIVGKPYDFGFDFENSDRFSCTELVAYCYPGLIVGKKIFGKTRIVADDFVDSPKLKIIWNSRET